MQTFRVFFGWPDGGLYYPSLLLLGRGDGDDVQTHLHDYACFVMPRGGTPLPSATGPLAVANRATPAPYGSTRSYRRPNGPQRQTRRPGGLRNIRWVKSCRNPTNVFAGSRICVAFLLFCSFLLVSARQLVRVDGNIQ